MQGSLVCGNGARLSETALADSNRLGIATAGEARNLAVLLLNPFC